MALWERKLDPALPMLHQWRRLPWRRELVKAHRAGLHHEELEYEGPYRPLLYTAA